MQQFDATAELAAVQQRRQLARKRRYRRSRLERHRAELVKLRQAGASYSDLQTWLRGQRIKVERSTVCRYLQQLPELAADG